MNGTAVIVGGGRVGRHTATQLIDHGYTVTVVERDAEKCETLATQQVGHVVEGDGEDRAILEEAGVADADVVAALTDHTPTNVIVCGLAREIAPEIRTLARVAYDGERDYQHLAAIDDIVYPAAAAADIAADHLLRQK
ncbi:potassium channel family protein [Halomarina salina]|uniref:Potassium channel family protein n=1 Tax=Halomarina salina TaxID=1872699 RepID=A0ABD5RT11_9EURY|nr:NAD(P)-binding protein [Halomarina salina]